MVQRARILPGAAEAMAALARLGGRGVVQALLTGNIRPLAEVKLGALGLTEHLDLDVGAYGDVHEVRAELVGPARRKAAVAYRTDFSGEATVIVGDTPLDIEAALVTGARAVGVATGHFSLANSPPPGRTRCCPTSPTPAGCSPRSSARTWVSGKAG